MHHEVTPEVFDVNSFCASHKISRATFYQLVKSGKGPRLTKIGKRTLISKESAADWRHRMEAVTASAPEAA